MGSPRLADTYLKVKDMDRAVSFYEMFLGVKAKYRYQDRWVSITDGLGLYNPTCDVENDVPMTEYDREVRMGNNVVVVFVTDGIEREHRRVKAIGATGVTDIVTTMSATPPHIGFGAGEQVLAYDRILQERLQEVKAPKIAINSADWQATNTEAAQRYGIEVVLMSGVGHFVMMEDPQTFNRLLDEAVKKFIHPRAPQ